LFTHDLWNDTLALESDLHVLEHLRRARQEFGHRLCEASKSQSEEVLELLRTESMYDFSEFFYLLKARGIGSENEIGAFAELHNSHIVELTKNERKMRRLGLKRDRLLQAIFTADTLPRLLQNWRERPGAMDQSNLGRFLSTLMSTETTRKLVVAGGEAGFLVREKTPYGTSLVSSTGIMEDVFGSTLRAFREQIQTRVLQP
jgi:hypothetical protein